MATFIGNAYIPNGQSVASNNPCPGACTGAACGADGCGTNTCAGDLCGANGCAIAIFPGLCGKNICVIDIFPCPGVKFGFFEDPGNGVSDMYLTYV